MKKTLWFVLTVVMIASFLRTGPHYVLNILSDSQQTALFLRVLGRAVGDEPVFAPGDEHDRDARPGVAQFHILNLQAAPKHFRLLGQRPLRLGQRQTE